ncbi:nuclear transport factor 2 family protein, partial [Gordonia amicalis]
MQPDEAAAREEIRDLAARYNLYGDTGRTEQEARLFTADGTLE